MEKHQFEVQMQRLIDQWPSAYGGERMTLFWEKFKDVGYQDFKEAIDELLMSQRAAPLAEQIREAIHVAKKKFFERQQAKDASIMGMMHQAAEVNDTADPAFVADCINLLDQYYSKKITYKEFEQGCDLLTVAANRFAKEKGYAKPENKVVKNLPVVYNPSDN